MATRVTDRKHRLHDVDQLRDLDRPAAEIRGDRRLERAAMGEQGALEPAQPLASLVGVGIGIGGEGGALRVEQLRNPVPPTLAEAARSGAIVWAVLPIKFSPVSRGASSGARPVSLYRLALEGTKLAHDAGTAIGLARLAHIASVQDQPVMGVQLPFGRVTFSSACSTSRGVLPGARPVRLATRKIWVSTAMVGCAERDVQHHIGGLAADAGQGLEGVAVGRHLAAMPLDEQVRQRDHVLGLGVEQADGLMCCCNPASPSASIAGRRVDLGEQLPVALLTPASVAWADSTTATSRV